MKNLTALAVLFLVNTNNVSVAGEVEGYLCQASCVLDDYGELFLSQEVIPSYGKTDIDAWNALVGKCPGYLVEQSFGGVVYQQHLSYYGVLTEANIHAFITSPKKACAKTTFDEEKLIQYYSGRRAVGG